MSPRPGLLGRLQPQSFRARIVLATVLALALTLLGTEVLLRSVFRAQIRESLQNRLQSQANGIARRVDRYGLTALNDIIPVLPSETYIEVRERGQTQRWNGTRRDGDVTASATLPAKSIDVRISEKPARGGSSWRVASMIALGLSAVGLVVWRVSGGIAQRLRSSAAELAGLAEHVADGELSARAEARDDELGRLAAAMNMMAERLEDSDRRQREFIADAAHELRTPVTAIEGFAGALTDGTAVSDDDRAEAATFIRDEAARLSALILQLQEVTWHDLDAPVEWRRVDLGELGREGPPGSRAPHTRSASRSPGRPNQSTSCPTRTTSKPSSGTSSETRSGRRRAMDALTLRWAATRPRRGFGSQTPVAGSLRSTFPTSSTGSSGSVRLGIEPRAGGPGSAWRSSGASLSGSADASPSRALSGRARPSPSDSPSGAPRGGHAAKSRRRRAGGVALRG